jgi:hypothetical protein
MVIVNFMFQWNYIFWWSSDSIATGNFVENSKIVVGSDRDTDTFIVLLCINPENA